MAGTLDTYIDKLNTVFAGCIPRGLGQDGVRQKAIAGADLGDGTAATINVPTGNVLSIAAAAGGSIKGTTGVLGSVLITAGGSVAVTFTDNAVPPNIIGVTPATTTVTGIPFVFNMPAQGGINASVPGAGGPAYTVSFA